VAQDIGYWFEGKVKDACAALQRDCGLFYHRFQDSKAAGNFTAGAPADFLLAFTGKVILVECKASRVQETLRSCLSAMVDDGQAGSMHRWIANWNEGFFLFYSDVLGQVEVWPADQVIAARNKGKPLPSAAETVFGVDELTDSLLEMLK
jgi:hypothetical protein